MKKILFTIFCFLGILLMSSCEDTRIRDINGIVWKDNFFNIFATSEQLQNQSHFDPDDVDNYYSNIIIEDKKYSCVICLQNQVFEVVLMDHTSNAPIYFFGNTYEFLWGHYGNLIKEKDKE